VIFAISVYGYSISAITSSEDDEVEVKLGQGPLYHHVSYALLLHYGLYREFDLYDK
jgi:hypothetical protein